MFELNDTVKIKSNGIEGTVIDVFENAAGIAKYIVESNKKGTVPGAYGGDWALFDCVDADLILIHR